MTNAYRQNSVVAKNVSLLNMPKANLPRRERIELLLDEGSSEEFDMFVTHRSTNFGLENEKCTEYQHGTILNILDMADSHKVQAIAEGKSVVDGVGQYLVNVQGGLRRREGPVRTREARPRHHLHHGQALARDPQAGEGGGERRGGRRSGDQYRDRLHPPRPSTGSSAPAEPSCWAA